MWFGFVFPGLLVYTEMSFAIFRSGVSSEFMFYFPLLTISFYTSSLLLHSLLLVNFLSILSVISIQFGAVRFYLSGYDFLHSPEAPMSRFTGGVVVAFVIVWWVGKPGGGSDLSSVVFVTIFNEHFGYIWGSIFQVTFIYRHFGLEIAIRHLGALLRSAPPPARNIIMVLFHA